MDGYGYDGQDTAVRCPNPSDMGGKEELAAPMVTIGDYVDDDDTPQYA